MERNLEMKRTVIVAALPIVAIAIVAAWYGANGQSKDESAMSGNDEQQLTELLRQWDEASARRDVEVLNGILADDFVFTNTSGRVITRSQYLSATIKAPDITLDVPVNSEDVEIRLYGTTAVITSRATQRGQPYSHDHEARFRYTDVWVKQEGRWQAVASQATRISN